MFFSWFFRVLRTTLLYDNIFMYDNMFNLKSQIYFGCISDFLICLGISVDFFTVSNRIGSSAKTATDSVG